MGSRVSAGLASRWRRALARRHRGGSDDGIAMIIAVLIMVVMILVPIAMMSANLGQMPLSRYDVDRQAALAAANAGVQDYINRLNHNPNYWEYDSANLPPDGNQALDTSPVSWVPVSAQSSTSFHYTVDATDLGSQGILKLTSYGKSRNVIRVIQVELRPVGFLDNLSLSNYNLVDPTVMPQQWLYQGSVSATQNACVYDHYQTSPSGTGPNAGACGNEFNYWITGNTVNGPIRSNDDYYLNGTPQFDGPVVSGDPNSKDSPYWYDPASGGTSGDHPVFEQPYSSTQPIQGSGTITFPPSDSSVESYASATPGTSGSGCLYTGPTYIQLNGTTMTVVSPETISTNTVPGGSSCVGTNVPLPANGVIYVQSVPASSKDPNYSASCPSGFNPSSWDGATSYGSGDSCSSGDVFVQGTLSGELTIAASNDIFITGNITYDSFTGNTVLGLITNNYVLVNHPIDSSGKSVVGTEPFYGGVSFTAPATYGSSTCPGSSKTDSSSPPQCTVTVDAAILSVQHTLGTASFYTGGVLGNLDIDGAIAGQFMDIEGVFSGPSLVDGYNENYTYDTRLERLTPPYFLDPSQTTWKEISYEECSTLTCNS